MAGFMYSIPFSITCIQPNTYTASVVGRVLTVAVVKLQNISESLDTDLKRVIPLQLPVLPSLVLGFLNSERATEKTYRNFRKLGYTCLVSLLETPSLRIAFYSLRSLQLFLNTLVFFFNKRCSLSSCLQQSIRIFFTDMFPSHISQ